MASTETTQSVRNDEREIVIRPPKGLTIADLSELIAYRGLVLSMIRRQLRTEYESTRLGILWALARPLLMTLVFAGLKHVSDARMGVEIAYPLYLYTGLIFWFWFADSVMSSAGSIRADAGLIRKIYFPRLISPIVPIAASACSLLVATLPVIPVAAFLGYPPGPALLLLPLVVAEAAILALGAGLIFAALTLSSRDWERFLALLLYIGLFLSPVLHAPEIVPPAARDLVFLNPMAGPLLGFRAVLFADIAFPWVPVLYSLAVAIAVLVMALFVFRRVERVLIDTI
jgi:lipopolysaccharide transport system permease protein